MRPVTWPPRSGWSCAVVPGRVDAAAGWRSAAGPMYSTDPDRSPNTLAITESRLRLHVRPWFGDRPIEHIGPADLRRWQRDLAAKVGPATLGQCRSLTLRIFQFAVDEGAIDTNPVRKAPPPSAAPTPTWSCDLASAAP